MEPPILAAVASGGLTLHRRLFAAAFWTCLSRLRNAVSVPRGWALTEGEGTGALAALLHGA
jgi:hypothetical protein